MKQHDVFEEVERLEIEAKQFGFYWQRIDQLLEQIHSETDEVNEAWNKKDNENLQEELGDLIHATFCLALFCGYDPAAMLQKSIDKFTKRYQMLVTLAKQDQHADLHGQPMETLMHYWNLAKQRTKATPI